MDTARAAKRCKGVEQVSLVYRRTRRYMPADEEELTLALKDGVEFKELLSPVRMEAGKLICVKTTLGEKDASGRAGVMETDEQLSVLADTVIAAVGEKVPTGFYEANGILVDDRGRARVNESLETNLDGVFVVGDGLYGPSIVVNGMAQAKTAAEAILGGEVSGDCAAPASKEAVYAKKGILAEPGKGNESDRCLSCRTVCENCVDVCPNRANISIHVPGFEMEQIIHMDHMCNECGNCESFCPYASAPYRDKFTLFARETDMADSRNEGFAVLDSGKVRCKVRLSGEEFIWTKGEASQVPEAVQLLMEAVCKDYQYLLG